MVDWGQLKASSIRKEGHLDKQKLSRRGALTAAAYLIISCLAPMVFSDQDLEVSGIFMDAKAAKALVNNQVVMAGDNIAGVTVVKISSDGVVFSRDGQEFLQHLREAAPVAINPKSSSRPVNTSAPAVAPVSAAASGPMKTLYGMPISKLFPDQATVKREIAEAAASASTSPAAMLQRANDIKSKADNKQKELEQRVKEMEGQ